MVLTEAQTAVLDELCDVADTAIGEEYKCIVHETAQKLGLTSAAVRDYFSAKKRLVGPELVRHCLSVPSLAMDQVNREPHSSMACPLVLR